MGCHGKMWPEFISPIWPVRSVRCADRSRSSSSMEVLNMWDVYIKELCIVPTDVRERQRVACVIDRFC